MTILTDVPESGQYFQEGAIVQLVMEIIDDNTGEPVQLQTATDFIISLQYPNGLYRQFPADLWTDGSDGKIYYTTRNNGQIVDLDQSGLYTSQAQASVNGVMLPQSSRSDFYISPNVGPMISYFGIVMKNIQTNIQYNIFVNTTGNLETELAPNALPGDYTDIPLILRDASGIYWQITVNQTGHVVTAVVATPSSFLTSLLLSDEDGTIWRFTVLTNGNLFTN